MIVQVNAGLVQTTLCALPVLWASTYLVIRALHARVIVLLVLAPLCALPVLWATTYPVICALHAQVIVLLVLAPLCAPHVLGDSTYLAVLAKWYACHIVKIAPAPPHVPPATRVTICPPVIVLPAQATAPLVSATLCALPVLGVTTYLVFLAILAHSAALLVWTPLHAPPVLRATT